jgi:hypothetical protein
MKKLLMAAAMLPGLVLAYHDDEGGESLADKLDRPLTFDRPEWNNPSPRVVVPIEPSRYGPSYITDDQIRTPEMECIRIVSTDGWRCQPR